MQLTQIQEIKGEISIILDRMIYRVIGPNTGKIKDIIKGGETEFTPYLLLSDYLNNHLLC